MGDSGGGGGGGVGYHLHDTLNSSILKLTPTFFVPGKTSGDNDLFVVIKRKRNRR